MLSSLIFSFPSVTCSAPPGYSRSMPKKEEGDYSDAKFDAFSGFSENLFGKSHYDEEDKQADRVFTAIDKHVDGKRKVRRFASCSGFGALHTSRGSFYKLKFFSFEVELVSK